MQKKIMPLLILILTTAATAGVPTYQLETILPAPDCTSVDLSPDGTKVCARIHYAPWDVGYRVFDANTYSILHNCHLSGTPWQGLVSADSEYLWTTVYYGGYVKKIDLSTCAEPTCIPVGPWPVGLAFDSQRRYLYVGVNMPGTGVIGSLKVIDTYTEQVIYSVQLNGEPGRCIVVGPRDEFVYLVTQNPGTEMLHKIRTSDCGVEATLALSGIGQVAISVSLDGNTIYVPDIDDDLVYRIDTGTMTVLGSWSIPSPDSFFVSPDGTHALVTSKWEPDIAVFDLLSEEMVQTIDVCDVGTWHPSWSNTPYWDTSNRQVFVVLCASEGGVAVLVRKAMLVGIDIKPGSYPNAINLGSQGLIPVAILSSETFDATTVDPDTVELAGADIAVRGKGNKFLAHEEDVDGDGLADLVVQVATANLDPNSLQDGWAVLTGETFDGNDIEGEDEITIVPSEE